MNLHLEEQDILQLKKKAEELASLYTEQADTIVSRVLEELERHNSVALVIFCDMSGSTRLASTQGIGQYLKSFSQFYMIIARAFAGADSDLRVLRTIGDELLLVRWFSRRRSDDVSDSLGRIAGAATQAMDELLAFAIPSKITMALYEKKASGQILRKVMRESFSDEEFYKHIGKEDLWGDEVNRAARIASIARDYQVLADEQTAKKLSGSREVTCDPPLPFYGKGLPSDILVSHVVSSKGRTSHLIHNYGFNAIATFQVSASGPNRYLVDHVLRVLAECFPGPMLAFAYNRVPWNPISPEEVEAREKLGNSAREIEADWDLYVGLLATDYNDFTRRIFKVRQKCKDNLLRSVTSPIWDPPGSQPVGRHQYNLESGAHAFYKVDEQGNIANDLPDMAHLSSYACAKYDGAEAMWQYTRKEKQDGFGDLGTAVEAWVTIGTTDVTILHKWTFTKLKEEVVDQRSRILARRDVIVFPEQVNVTTSRFCHWVGRRIRIDDYKTS